jgi:hypothetical protein
VEKQKGGQREVGRLCVSAKRTETRITVVLFALFRFSHAARCHGVLAGICVCLVLSFRDQLQRIARWTVAFS